MIIMEVVMASVLRWPVFTGSVARRLRSHPGIDVPAGLATEPVDTAELDYFFPPIGERTDRSRRQPILASGSRS